MKFTLEQFKELGDMCLDDFPFRPNKEEELLWLFNSFSRQTQGLVLTWGFSDTEVREKIFEDLIRRIGFPSPESYYKSDTHKNYHEDGKCFSISDLVWGE